MNGYNMISSYVEGTCRCIAVKRLQYKVVSAHRFEHYKYHRNDSQFILLQISTHKFG